MANSSADSLSASAPVQVLAPPASEERSAADLATRLAQEMKDRWDQGDRAITEEFLALYSELWNQPEAAIELIYEETCLRREFGEEVDRANLLKRFPQWQLQLEILLDCHLILEPKPEPIFPEVGETLGDFRMVAELGRGGQGCVFLATQPSLSDRPVVLKLTPCDDGREHLSLARFQHTHIVPLYAVEDFQSRNIRALCMPYFGNATLRHILDDLESVPLNRRTGQHLLDALARIQEKVPVQLPARGPVRQMLARATYVQAVCWVGACLAEALHYAHERGLVHLDLKPSNLLLAVDGQPMLLDFHLTQKPIHPEDPLPDWLGGTPVYMSPEQKAAVAAAQNGAKVPRVVDGRADVYSLGVVLYEALGGSLPYRPGVSPPLCRCNPSVSVGLSDVIAKCMDPDPAQRYAQAAHLAADLQRHLANLHLLGVRNRSPLESWRKWRRRRPYTVPLLGVFLATVIVAGAAGTFRRANLEEQKTQARAVLDKGQEFLQQGNYGEALSAVRRGWALAEGLPGNEDLLRDVQALQQRTELGQMVQDLHQLAGRVRFLYGVDGLPVPELRSLEAGCRPFWEKRRLILDRLGQVTVPGADPRQIRTDLLDLALLWTDLRVRLASSADVNQVRREALEVLAQAEALLGPSPVLRYERRQHAAALNLTKTEPAPAASALPQTAWEHYALGRSMLRSGDLQGAAAELAQAVQLEPQGFWPNFYQGICSYRLANHWDAAIAFSVCIGASPESPACFYNRALAHAALDRPEAALRDYDHALRLDPRLAPALLNRGLLHFRQRHYPEAAADWRHAQDLGADAATAQFYLALAQDAQGNRSGASAHLDRALSHNPDHAEARALREKLDKAK